jgi:hypothetical protein
MTYLYIMYMRVYWASPNIWQGLEATYGFTGKLVAWIYLINS